MSLRPACLSAVLFSLLAVGCGSEPTGKVADPKENTQEALTQEIEASGISAEDYAKGLSPEQANAGQEKGK